MSEETRRGLIDILRSWLTTWEDAEPKAYPKELVKVVEKLERSENLDVNELNLCLFHLWQRNDAQL